MPQTRLPKPTKFMYAIKIMYIVNLKSHGNDGSSKRPKHANDISGKTRYPIIRRDPSRGLFGEYLEIPPQQASASAFLAWPHGASSGGEIFNVSSRRKETVGGCTYISLLETSTIGTTKEVKGEKE